MKRVQFTNAKWIIFAALGLAVSLSSGCARMYHALHYNSIALKMHERPKSYFHSESTGRILVKDPCYNRIEPGCFGFEPTCWTHWPCECEPCPVQGECISEDAVGDTPTEAVPTAEVVPQPEPNVEVESDIDAPGESIISEDDIIEPEDVLEPSAAVVPIQENELPKSDANPAIANDTAQPDDNSDGDQSDVKQVKDVIKRIVEEPIEAAVEESSEPPKQDEEPSLRSSRRTQRLVKAEFESLKPNSTDAKLSSPTPKIDAKPRTTVAEEVSNAESEIRYDASAHVEMPAALNTDSFATEEPLIRLENVVPASATVAADLQKARSGGLVISSLPTFAIPVKQPKVIQEDHPSDGLKTTIRFRPNDDEPAANMAERYDGPSNIRFR